jgi:TRAP-type C4-dicarboxylate transport system permease small subunit
MSADPLPDEASPGNRAPKSWVPVRIEEFLAAITMGVVAIITFANVVTRYFTDVSFAFTEEYSIWLMVVMTFLGASVAVVRDRHMRITFLSNKLPPAWRRAAELLSMTAIAVMFGVLVVYGASTAYDDYRFEVTSPALGIPQWLYTVWMPLLSVVVVGRAIGRAVRIARRLEP